MHARLATMAAMAAMAATVRAAADRRRQNARACRSLRRHPTGHPAAGRTA